MTRSLSATQAIRAATSNEDYRDGLRNLNLLVNAMGVIIFLLTATLVFFIATYHPQGQNFAETAEGRQMRLVALRAPNINNMGLLNWATEAGTAAMTFGFNDYEQRLGSINEFFTKSGWESFRQAVIKSNIIKNVVDNQQILTAVPKGPAAMVWEGLDAGRYAWVIEVPLLVTIRAGATVRTQTQTIRMMVVKVPTSELPSGIGIDLWISF